MPSWLTIPDLVAWILGGAGLTVAAWTARRQHTLQRRVVEIEESRRAEEQSAAQRASLHPTVTLTTDGYPRLLLTVENRGPARAREVVAKIDGIPVHELHVQASGFQPGPRIALPDVIESFATAAVPLPPLHANGEVRRVTLEWRDAGGEPRIVPHHLAFPLAR